MGGAVGSIVTGIERVPRAPGGRGNSNQSRRSARRAEWAGISGERFRAWCPRRRKAKSRPVLLAGDCAVDELIKAARAPPRPGPVPLRPILNPGRAGDRWYPGTCDCCARRRLFQRRCGPAAGRTYSYWPG